MANLNHVTLQGNLTRDPETRISTAGLAIVNFAVAVNSGFGDKEEVSFVDCTAFGKQGEALAKYFTKGKQIIVEGRLRQDRWEDKETGQKRSKLAVVVNAFFFTGTKGTPNEVQDTSPAEAVEATATVASASDDDGKLF